MNRNEKHLYVATAIAVAGIVYGLGHWPIKVSFQHPALNNIVLTMLVFSIPFLFMALAWVTRRRLIKASLILLGIASLFPAIPIGFIAAIEAVDILESGKGAEALKKSQSYHKAPECFASMYRTVVPRVTMVWFFKRNLKYL